MSSVFITGVSSGLGWALAEEYLRRGAAVFGVSRRQPGGLGQNSQFLFRPADLSDLSEIHAVIAELLDGVRELETVVLNAAELGPIADLSEVRTEELQRTMDVNVWSNHKILKGMFERGIRIEQVVAISSGAAVQPSRGWAAYAISKAALNLLMGLYAAERPETHFSALAPGIVDTPMQARLSEQADDPRYPALQILKAARGTERMPRPEKIAGRLIDAFAALKKKPNGSFVDFRQMI